MPPKSSAGKEKDLTDEDDVLQAVILADSFNKRFKPLTVGKPRCLLPVCNATLLDWTFESLALAGVQEIFVICRSYPELVKAAIRDSKWSKPMYGLKIVPIITSKETFTPGDAMRDIYTRGIITSDFVLVMGDLVSNVKIDEVVRVHRERRKTNKDAIMTMVVKESGAVHRTRSQGESAVFVLDAETSECLHYESVTGYPPKRVAKIPREIFKEHPEVEIRYDLIDCCIDVCSVEVPSLFQDNFDYGDIRRDFVHGILTSDLLMKSIHCYVLKDGYAARVADTRSYDAVSKDILSRWTFPLVPDDNHPGGHSYEHLRGNKYIARGNSVSLSRTCKIGPNTLIGAHTTISANASIQSSVIGRNCFISPNVVLKNVYIFDGTRVGLGSVIEETIIGENVTISDGCRIERGCLVGDGVVLGKGARLGPFDRVSKRRDKVVVAKQVNGSADSDGVDESEEEEQEDSELEDVAANQDNVLVIVGEGSNAIVWPQGPREDDEDIDEVEQYNNQRLMRLGDTCSDLELDPEDDSVAYDSDYDSDTESVTSTASNALSVASSNTSYTNPSAALHTLQATAAVIEFQSEVRQSLERAFAEGHSVDNAAVELKTLRMASNVDLKKVREAVVAAIVEKIRVVEEGGAEQRKEIAGVVKRWGALIDKIGGVDAVETVEVLQYHCAQSTRLTLFGQILAALYQEDIVEEDDIRVWHVTPAAKGDTIKAGTTLAENVKRCWAVGAKMIEQFDEQESTEDEEDGVEKPALAYNKAEEDSGYTDDDQGDDDESSESEDDGALKAASSAPQSTFSITPESNATVRKTVQESGEDGSGEEEDDDEESEEEDKPAAIVPTAATSTSLASASTTRPSPFVAAAQSPPSIAQAKKGGESSEEDEGDDEEEEESEEDDEESDDDDDSGEEDGDGDGDDDDDDSGEEDDEDEDEQSEGDDASASHPTASVSASTFTGSGPASASESTTSSRTRTSATGKSYPSSNDNSSVGNSYGNGHGNEKASTSSVPHVPASFVPPNPAPPIPNHSPQFPTHAPNSHSQVAQPDDHLLSPNAVPGTRPRPRKPSYQDSSQNRGSQNRLSQLFIQGALGPFHLHKYKEGAAKSPLSPTLSEEKERSPVEASGHVLGTRREKVRETYGKVQKLVKRVVSMKSLRKVGSVQAPGQDGKSSLKATSLVSPSVARRFRRDRSEPPNDAA